MEKVKAFVTLVPSSFIIIIPVYTLGRKCASRQQGNNSFKNKMRIYFSGSNLDGGRGKEGRGEGDGRRGGGFSFYLVPLVSYGRQIEQMRTGYECKRRGSARLSRYKSYVIVSETLMGRVGTERGRLEREAFHPGIKYASYLRLRLNTAFPCMLLEASFTF